MKTILIGVAVALLASTASFAADVYQPVEQPLPAAEAVVAESASGWYLRGDAGYAFTKLRGAQFYQGSNGFVRDFSTAELKNTYSIGGGVGYQVNHYLRTDVTLDYFGKADFKGSTKGNCGFAPVPCTSRDISAVAAWSLMANAYVDIGTYGAFTPYVGAGIGGTQVKWDKLKNTSCADNQPGCDPTFEHEGRSKWRFTYALMAGTSIDVTCNLKADVGYRFRHVQGGDMFGFNAGGGPGSDKGLYLHEARAGLRYSLNGCPEQAYVPDYPVEQPVYK